MISRDYRLHSDFLREETKRFAWVQVSEGVYRKNGVLMKVQKLKKGERMRVITFLKHPHWGDTTLVRENINRAEFVEILKNPRVHTDKGWNPNSPKRRMDEAFNRVNQKEELKL